MKDPVEKDPAKRYKMLFRGPPKLAGFMVNGAYSGDGLHWTFYDDNPIIPMRSDTANNVFWDPRIDRYVVITRLFSALGEFEPASGGGSDPKAGHLRIVGRTESRDFENWTPAQVLLIPDERDRETEGTLHDMQVLQYEDVYFGFLGICHNYETSAPDAQTESEDVEAHGVAGQMTVENVELTFSRDGVRWIRAGDRKPFMDFVRPYTQSREWIQIWQAPVIVGDEIWFYYNGTESVYSPNPLPDGALSGDMSDYDIAVGLAKLRLDGFISVEASDEEGTLTTKPFKFKGNRLMINADAGAGELAVEILEYRNLYRSIDVTPMDGFTRAECVALKDNDVRHVVAWKHGSELRGLEGKTIKLKFYLRNAKLYSFQFRQEK